MSPSNPNQSYKQALYTRELESFVDQLSVAAALSDLHGRMMKVNPAFTELFGWTEQEVLGRKLPMVPEERLPEAERILHTLWSGGRVEEFESNCLKKTGEFFPALITLSTLKNSEGKMIGVTILAQDLSERNKIRGELAETDAKYKLIVDNMSDYIAIFDPYGKLKYASPSNRFLFDDNSHGNPFVSDLIHHEDREKITQCFVHMIATKKECQAEFRHRNADGWAYLDAKGFPIIGHDGQIESILVVARDITDRKKSEEMIKESNKRYRRLMDVSPEAILVYSDGIVIYANEACLQLVHAKEASQIIGTSVLDYLHPDERKKAIDHMRDITHRRGGQDYQELTLVTFDGQSKQIEASSIQFDDVFGRPAVQTVIRDVTEKKKTEEVLRRSDKLSALGQMAAGIAHEIRNPLTSLLGFVQLMRAKKSNQMEYLDIMQSELERINFIVNEFMKIAKPQATDFKVKDLTLIVENIVSLMQSQAILNNIGISLVSDNQVIPVYCDENHLKQVFLNLLKNAIEAMPHGGEITIHLSLGADNKATISIADQGQGIPESLLAKLGDPFFTTKENGTGLGLMVCFQIIEGHNGTMHFTSRKGEGTTVHIVLPGL